MPANPAGAALHLALEFLLAPQFMPDRTAEYPLLEHCTTRGIGEC
jgi:hypothetical protein